MHSPHLGLISVGLFAGTLAKIQSIQNANVKARNGVKKFAQTTLL